MSVVYLISIILGVAAQNVLKKPYTKKNNGKGVYLYGALTAAFAAIFFVVTSKSFVWNTHVLLYSSLFALAYCVSIVFSLEAVASGSLSLTALVVSYSLLVPTLYGLLFLKDPVGSWLVLGLILLCISLFLIGKKSENNKISLKWIINVSLAFIGNGMCSVVQKAQQLAFGGRLKNEFMIVALAVAVAVLLVVSIIKERQYIPECFKNGWLICAGTGLFNGMVNLFVMVLAGMMQVSVMFPLISAGGIITTFIISKSFFKETFSKLQLLGFVFGIAAVIVLNF